jgi:CpeT protein
MLWRMTTPRLVVIAAVAGISFAGCASEHHPGTFDAEPGRVSSAESRFDRLASELTGTFSNAEQGMERAPDGKPVWMDVELHIVRIEPPPPIAQSASPTDASPVRWFYVEQAEVGSLDKPYRQHISEVRPTPDGGFISRVHTFAGDPHVFAGWWQHPESFTHHLNVYDLELNPGCEILVRPQANGGFAGGTVGSGCPNSSKGATYATTQLTITPTELRAWDRGYDAAGRQVWGSTRGPYIFKKK